ncbi:MAG: hypothetical protein ACK4S4_13930 [Pyrinomonadaceae bacterium]
MGRFLVTNLLKLDHEYGATAAVNNGNVTKQTITAPTVGEGGREWRLLGGARFWAAGRPTSAAGLRTSCGKFAIAAKILGESAFGVLT